MKGLESMKRILYSGLAALALLCLAGTWQPARTQEASSRTLKVKLHYSGTGLVDEKHKIFVFLFDTPDFVQGGDATPISWGSATAKDATITISAIPKSPVYLIAAYDPTGQYDASSPPPSGSSLAIYGKTPGQPDPIGIDAGKTTEIDVRFADDMKMP
jgi:hypothetical protein